MFLHFPSFRREPLYLALRNRRSALTHSLLPPLLRSLFCLHLNEIGLRSQNRTCYPSHHHHRHLHGVLRITRYYCDLFSGYKGVYFLFHCACHYGIHCASPRTSLGTNMDPEEDVVPFPLLVNPAPLLALEGQGGGLSPTSWGSSIHRESTQPIHCIDLTFQRSNSGTLPPFGPNNPISINSPHIPRQGL